MSELNRKILVRVPFFVLAFIFIPTLPYINRIDGLQTAGWILAGILVLLAIGMGIGVTIERRVPSARQKLGDERHADPPSRGHATQSGVTQ